MYFTRIMLGIVSCSSKKITPPETRNNDRIINQIIKIVGPQEYVEFEQGRALDGSDGNRCLEKRRKVCTMCKLKLAINDPTQCRYPRSGTCGVAQMK